MYKSELTIINVKKDLTMKIANVYQQIESIGSIMVNLLNLLLLGDWWLGGSSSFVIVRMVDGVDENDLRRFRFGRFPLGRFKLFFCSWFASSAMAESSLGVSRETDDGIWWMLNAALIWSRFCLCFLFIIFDRVAQKVSEVRANRGNLGENEKRRENVK